jgi:hypothetical protein|tara:strand:+ start:776 stop:2002 length:1227 start_codon:yes stop_codon:yes gene_type:complete
MKYFLITLGILVYLLLYLFSSSLKAEVVTTNNLLNQTFTTSNNWQGQLSGNHGTGIIAGENGGYVETINDISLKNDVGLTEAQIQNGWIGNQSAQAWFWNDNTQDLTMKQIVTSSSGSTVTQTKIVTGSCATYNGCTFQATGNNTFISTLNTNTDYSIKNRFEFNSTGNYTTSHNAADLKLPSLTITYENTPISVNDQKDIIENARIIVEEIQETKVPIIKETVVEIKEEPKPQPVVTTVEEKPEPSTEVKEEVKAIEEKKEEPKEEVQVVEEKTEPKEELKEEPKIEPKEEPETMMVEKKNSPVSVATTTIDGQVHSIEKNLQLKSIAILKSMINNSMINVYAIPFYKSKKIYEDQLSIADTKLLYTGNSLGVYISKDPVVQYQNALIDIRSEKQQLLNEIQVLRNG